MLSNLQIAFALGGKVYGRGVLAPAPGRGPDDISMSIMPNAAGDDYVVDPAEHQNYVDQAMEAARQRTEQRKLETQRIRIANGLPAVEEKHVLPPGQATWFPVPDAIAAAPVIGAVATTAAMATLAATTVPETESKSIEENVAANGEGTTVPRTIEQKIEFCVAEIISTKPGSVQEIAALLIRILPAPRDRSPNLRPYVAVYKRLMAIDRDHVAKDMLGGTPTLTPLEVDANARKMMRAPQNHRAAKIVAGHLAIPDRFLVLARMEEIKEGRDKSATVVPFELKELS
jgi:hypothetical protein